MEEVTQKSSGTLFRLSRYFIMILAIYFLFYGIIANLYGKTPGNYLLFVYLNFWTTEGWYLILILFSIYTIQAYYQDFMVYAFRYNILSIPFFIVISLIYYSINYQMFSLEPFVLYFGSYNGYLNILIIFIIIIPATILGTYIKYENVLGKSIRIGVRVIFISVLVIVVIYLYTNVFDVLKRLIELFIESL